MRVVFGVVSLLVVLLIVGTLAKKQLDTMPALSISTQNPVLPDQAATLPVTSLSATPQVQSQQIQQQIKQSVEAAMQTRNMPEDQP